MHVRVRALPHSCGDASVRCAQSHIPDAELLSHTPTQLTYRVLLTESRVIPPARTRVVALTVPNGRFDRWPFCCCCCAQHVPALLDALEDRKDLLGVQNLDVSREAPLLRRALPRPLLCRLSALPAAADRDCKSFCLPVCFCVCPCVPVFGRVRVRSASAACVHPVR